MYEIFAALRAQIKGTRGPDDEQGGTTWCSVVPRLLIVVLRSW